MTMHTRYEATGGRHNATTWRRRLKGLGVLGFAFFLIKGLVWLALPVLLFEGCASK